MKIIVAVFFVTNVAYQIGGKLKNCNGVEG